MTIIHDVFFRPSNAEYVGKPSSELPNLNNSNKDSLRALFALDGFRNKFQQITDCDVQTAINQLSNVNGGSSDGRLQNIHSPCPLVSDLESATQLASNNPSLVVGYLCYFLMPQNTDRNFNILTDTQVAFGFLEAATSNHYGTRSLQEVRDAGKALDSELASLKRKLSDVDAIFETKAALKKPVQYWRTKKGWHYFGAAGFGLVFAAIIVALIALLAINVESIKKDFLPAADAESWSVASAVLIAAPLLGVGWILRMLMRLFLHNLKLAADAGYKEILTDTYLSMANEGVAQFSGDEREILFRALFSQGRESSDADLLPPNVAEILRSNR